MPTHHWLLSPPAHAEATCPAVTRSWIVSLVQSAVKLLLTACVSSAIILGALFLFGERSDCASPVGTAAPNIQSPLHLADFSSIHILGAAGACTLLLYCLIAGAATLIRRGHSNRPECDAVHGAECHGPCASGSYGACGMRALEAGWGPILAITDGRGHATRKGVQRRAG
ncbi:hypothetical protein DFH06DRAFT_1134478 [Mycena polygramma]|nr:hypothetical protein DFH06DRAFT_1134478 [Mycena polygramma]